MVEAGSSWLSSVIKRKHRGESRVRWSRRNLETLNLQDILGKPKHSWSWIWCEMWNATRQHTVAKEILIMFLGFYCSFVFFCRTAAGLLTLLISFFSLASLCKSENKYRGNEDLKVYFYQVSCYFSVILNVRGFLRANFYLLSKNVFLPRPQFSRKKWLFLRVFSLAISRGLDAHF